MIINHRLPFSAEAESLQRFAKLSISSEFPLSSPQFSEFGYSQRVHKSLAEQKITNFRLSDLKYPNLALINSAERRSLKFLKNHMFTEHKYGELIAKVPLVVSPNCKETPVVLFVTNRTTIVLLDANRPLSEILSTLKIVKNV